MNFLMCVKKQAKYSLSRWLPVHFPVRIFLSHQCFHVKIIAPNITFRFIATVTVIHCLRQQAVGTGETVSGVIFFQRFHHFICNFFIIRMICMKYLQERRRRLGLIVWESRISDSKVCQGIILWEKKDLMCGRQDRCIPF